MPREQLGVARGWADCFADTHASQAWLLHEYLHPTGSVFRNRCSVGRGAPGWQKETSRRLHPFRARAAEGSVSD
jgi:hypothetical protein